MQAQLRSAARVHPQRHQLEIEQHVDHVLLDALDARVLMQHAVDFHFGDGRAGHGRQQHAPQRVAERMAETALERFDDHPRLSRRDRLYLDHAGLEELAH